MRSMNDRQELTGRTDPAATEAGPPAGLERTLWLATYVLLVLAPVGLMYVAGPTRSLSFGTVLAASLGFAGLAMLGLQLVLPSRARAFTSPFGVDVLLRFHREVGLLALIVVLGHVVVLMLDDASRLELLNPAKAPWRAQAGVGAILALGALIVTSLRRQDFGLRYEHWRAVHVALGVAVLGLSVAHAVGVSHYLSVGPLRWAALLLVVAAAVGVFYLRVGRPFAATGRRYLLRDVRRERGGAVTLELEAEGHDGLSFRAGQFAWLKLGSTPYSLTEHPFSLSSSALRPHRPEFTIKNVGDFTAGVGRLDRGEPVLVDGPHGSFAYSADDPGFALIAGGIGITPCISLLRTLVDAGDRRPVVLVYANRSWEDVTFREELDELVGLMNLRVVHVLSQAHESWAGERGRVEEALIGRVLPLEARRWRGLICGPPPMTAAAREALIALGVKPQRIHAENFASA